MEDINYTPEFVRQFEQHMLSGGRRRWVLYALHGSQDRIAGLTEVLWSPARPQILEQGFTGVRPDFRNHGLGHWIKAAMLDKVLRELPEAKVIRAGNATSNAPMLKINQALGFKLRVSWTIWQVETDSVEKYLDART
jgi:RimJ/RimL family protein N-acetyltransferase